MVGLFLVLVQPTLLTSHFSILKGVLHKKWLLFIVFFTVKIIFGLDKWFSEVLIVRKLRLKKIRTNKQTFEQTPFVGWCTPITSDVTCRYIYLFLFCSLDYYWYILVYNFRGCKLQRFREFFWRLRKFIPAELNFHRTF